MEQTYHVGKMEVYQGTWRESGRVGWLAGWKRCVAADRLGVHTVEEPKQMTKTNSAWNRLQCLSCEHSLSLWRSGATRRKYSRGVEVSEDIRDNVEILGRGNDEEIKARVLWYLTFHPGLFDACSARGWELSAPAGKVA